MYRVRRRAGELTTGAPAAVPPRPVRDQPTRATYAYFAMWGWFLYCLGPTVPLLRDAQHTSRAVAGLHGTFLALGTLCSAPMSVPLVRRLTRRGVLVLSGTLVGLGVVALALGPAAPYTIAAVFVAGFGGSLTLNAANATLADHHGPVGPAILGEANALAAGCGIVAPLSVGLSVALGLTWRGGILLTVPFAAGAVLLLRRAPRVAALVSAGPPRPTPLALEPDVALPARAYRRLRARPEDAPAPFLRVFWLTLALVCACVGVEFCATFWAADLLHTHDGLAKDSASASVSLLLVGMTIGRSLSTPLTRRFTSATLLALALGTAAVGWALFWATPVPAVALGGLLVLGLGLALQYPLAIARLMDVSQGRPDTGIAFASVAVAIASGGAPFLLGALADRIGSHAGFLVVPALLAIAAALLVAAFSGSVRRSRPPAPAGPGHRG